MNDIGYGKSIAAVLAGAVATIAIYIVEQWSGHPLPAEITNSIQTVFTAGAVFLTPHTLAGGGGTQRTAKAT